MAQKHKMTPALNKSSNIIGESAMRNLCVLGGAEFSLAPRSRRLSPGCEQKEICHV